MTSDLMWSHSKIGGPKRKLLHGHSSFVMWLTGLSGSGKSTLAKELEVELYHVGVRTVILDGDNLRHGLCKDLDFSEAGRRENIRRVGEVSKLFVDAGIVTLVSTISPYQEMRNEVRKLFDCGRFIEIYVKCSIDTCMSRDPKGLYQKIKAGLIQDFTGVDSPYEEPLNPEIVVNSELMTIEESVALISSYIECNNLLEN